MVQGSGVNMRKLIALTLSIFMCYQSVCFAAGSPPTKVEKGQTFVVPEEGWFYTVPSEVIIRQRLVDADTISKQLALTQDNNKHLQEAFKLQEQISDKYRKSWLDAEDSLSSYLKSENRSKFWYIFLGGALVVASGLTVGYASKLLK
jgi:hypothetical protein